MQPPNSYQPPSPPRPAGCCVAVAVAGGSGRVRKKREGKREKKREMASNSRHIGSIVISLPHLFHAPSEFSRLEPDRVRDGSTDDSRLSPQSAYLLPPRYLLHTVYLTLYVSHSSAQIRPSLGTLHTHTHSSSHAKCPLAMLLYMFHQAPNWRMVSKIWICVAVARRCLVKRYCISSTLAPLRGNAWIDLEIFISCISDCSIVLGGSYSDCLCRLTFTSW